METQLQKIAKLLQIAGDPSRLAILNFLFEKKEACVSTIAEELKLNIACTSHHLQILKQGKLVNCKRKGLTICYYPETNRDTSLIKKVIGHAK